MATIITEECINCGACEPECPNTAIYAGAAEYEWQGEKRPALSADFYYIVPEKCTECVGFFDHEACATVCPVDCCIPDPKRPETEDVLMQRARDIHPDKDFGADVPSRFRRLNGVAAAQVGNADKPEPAAATPVPKPEVSPVLAPASTATLDTIVKPAAPAVKAAPSAIIAKTPPAEASAQATKPAAPPNAASAAPASAPAARVQTVGEESVVASAVAGRAPSPTSGRVENPIPKPKKVLGEGDPTRHFEGELEISFDEGLRRVRRVRRRGGSHVAGLALSVASPLLGALDDDVKRTLEQVYKDTGFSSVRLATALNIGVDFLLYPIAFYLLGLLDALRVFAHADKNWLAIGVLVAAVETLIRLRDAIVHAKPPDEVRYGPSFYGMLLSPLFRSVLSTFVRGRRSGWIPVEGFYAGDFEPKREREKRYGEVYTIEEFDGGYYLRMEMPRRIPRSAARDELGFGEEMPDYDLRVTVDDGTLTVRGSVVDSELRAVCGVSPAFPADFKTDIALDGPVAGFRHRYGAKLLEIAVLKQGA